MRSGQHEEIAFGSRAGRWVLAVAAGLAALGGAIAWFGISDDALRAEPERRGQPPVEVSTDYSCALAGPPQRARASET